MISNKAVHLSLSRVDNLRTKPALSIAMFGFVYWPWSESHVKRLFRCLVLETLVSFGCFKNFVTWSQRLSFNVIFFYLEIYDATR